MLGWYFGFHVSRTAIGAVQFYCKLPSQLHKTRKANAVFFWRGVLELVLVTDLTEPGLNPNRVGSGCSAKEVDLPS